MEKKLVNKTNEAFEETSRRFRIVKVIARVLGSIFVFFGFVIIVLSYGVTYFVEGLSNPDQVFLIVFGVGWIIFGVSLFICLRVSILSLPNEEKVSKYLDDYYTGKEKPQETARFFSFRISRLLAAFFLLFLGFLDLFILTGKISHHQPPFGNSVFLGGPSFYYTVAFFPQGFGLGFLLYTFFKSHRAHIASSENYLYYNEFKKNTFLNADIPKEEIEVIRYQNNRVGISYIWLFLILPFSIFTAINGVYMLRAPLLQNPIQGILLVLTAILEIPAVFYITLRPSNYLNITTKDNLYETWFVPHKMELRDLPLVEEDRKGKIDKTFMDSHNISATHRQYTNLVLGIFFLVSGLLMLVLYYVVGIFGHLYTSASVLFGTMLVIRAVAGDFSNRNGVQVTYEESEKALSFEQNFRSHFMRINTLHSTDVEITRSFRHINFLDILLIPVLLFMGTRQTILSWAIATTPNLILISVITTVFLGLIYFLFFIQLCGLTDHLRLTTPTMKYSIPITLSNPKIRFLNGALSKDLKKSFILRCAFIALIGILTLILTLTYLNLNFYV